MDSISVGDNNSQGFLSDSMETGAVSSGVSCFSTLSESAVSPQEIKQSNISRIKPSLNTLIVEILCPLRDKFFFSDTERHKVNLRNKYRRRSRNIHISDGYVNEMPFQGHSFIVSARAMGCEVSSTGSGNAGPLKNPTPPKPFLHCRR